MKGAWLGSLACLASCSPSRMVVPLRYGVVAETREEAFRDTPPPAPVVSDAPDVPPRAWTLPNGMRVLLVERHEFPLLAAQLVLKRGALDIGDPGGAHVRRMTYLYGRGGSDEAYDGLLEQARSQGISFAMGASTSGSWISTRAAPSSLDTCLSILSSLSFGARLTADEHALRSTEFEERARLRLISIDQAERMVLFGARNPLGFAGEGEGPFSFEAATTLHDDIFQPRYTTLVVVGDVAPEKLEPSARAAFASWVNPADTAMVTMSDIPPRAPRVSVVSRRGLVQMRAAVFSRGPLPSSPEMGAFRVMAEILGGGHSSGLFDALRREEGATYDPVSAVLAERTATWWTLAASYDPDKAIAGVATVFRAIASVRAGNVDGGAVVAARERLLAAWREAMASVQGAANAYAGALLLGVDPDNVREFPVRIARVGRDDVVRVANRYLGEGTLHVVFIGEDRWLDVGPLGMGGALSIEESKQ